MAGELHQCSVFIQKVIKMCVYIYIYIYIFPIFLHDFRVLEKALLAFLGGKKRIEHTKKNRTGG